MVVTLEQSLPENATVPEKFAAAGLLVQEFAWGNDIAAVRKMTKIGRDRVKGMVSAFVDAACSANNSLRSWFHDDNPDERWTVHTPPLEERHCAFKRFQEFTEWSGSEASEERAALRRQCRAAARVARSWAAGEPLLTAPPRRWISRGRT